jgi:anaerobic selenocysteine-containing dehydrogenase
MNRADIARLGLAEGELVTLTTVVHDDVRREVGGLRVTAYDIPAGTVGGYYPECNPLVPLWHHAKGSKTPAYKSVPVTLRRDAAGQPPQGTG